MAGNKHSFSGFNLTVIYSPAAVGTDIKHKRFRFKETLLCNLDPTGGVNVFFVIEPLDFTALRLCHLRPEGIQRVIGNPDVVKNLLNMKLYFFAGLRIYPIKIV